jgi:hypothetical protein
MAKHTEKVLYLGQWKQAPQTLDGRFCCPVEGCDRTYSHPGSLRRHVSQEHGFELSPDGYLVRIPEGVTRFDDQGLPVPTKSAGYSAIGKYDYLPSGFTIGRVTLREGRRWLEIR